MAEGVALTVRRPEWLGHLGAPVILLFANLAGSIARHTHNLTDSTGRTAAVGRAGGTGSGGVGN
ncbi:hypothetical protein AADR41_15925 [Streptomyces sp. CLV115]|uniref:hypothetical protein n=1 Tax=Streptomyces sp. CLV115 TaxID=3138502 RepID=UPI00313DEAB5